MPVVLLVRHGQASFGAEDYDVLSEVGHRQAALVADRLRRLPIERLVTGTMVRQRDTASPIEGAAGVAAAADPRFDEYDHVALVQRVVRDPSNLQTGGREVDRRRAFQAVLEQALDRWTAGTAGDDGEPFTEFRQRVRDGLMAATDGLSGTAVVVTSGGVIASVCADALELDRHAWGRLNTVIVNSSITKLVLGRRGTTLVSINDHAHLEDQPAQLLTYR